MIRVLLQYEDAYFVEAFSNYASAKCPDVDVLCFTTKEKADSYLERRHPRLDIVISKSPFPSLPNVQYLMPGEVTRFADQGGVS